MLRSVYLKSLRDRLLGVSIGVVALFLTAWMGLWAYAGVDGADTYFQSMPAAYVELLGITRDSGTAGLMMSMMFSLMGAFVLGGLAVSMGASAIAGEEHDGTMNVLATVPRSRARLHASKAAAYLTLVIAGSAAASASYWLAARLVGEDVSSLNLAAATVHLTAVLLVYGILAFALGAATGNRALASGTATGLLIVSFLGAGLLPMLGGTWETVAKWFPWYYIDGTSPLINGVNWPQIWWLSGAWVVLLVGGGVLFVRRDLRAGATASSLVDRLRANPRMARRHGSRARKRQHARPDHQGRERQARRCAPCRLWPACARGDHGAHVQCAWAPPSATWLQGCPRPFSRWSASRTTARQRVGITARCCPSLSPAVFAIVAVGAGVALAARSASAPSRWCSAHPSRALRVRELQARGAGAAHRAVRSAAVHGNLARQSHLQPGDGCWAHRRRGMLQAALGLVFGTLGVRRGRVDGRSNAAAWTGTGVAVIGWAVNAFVGVNDNLVAVTRSCRRSIGRCTRYPLDNGMDWSGLAVLATASGLLAAVGLVGYRRRDLRIAASGNCRYPGAREREPAIHVGHEFAGLGGPQSGAVRGGPRPSER